jgi:hypothetical protein
MELLPDGTYQKKNKKQKRLKEGQCFQYGWLRANILKPTNKEKEYSKT